MENEFLKANRKLWDEYAAAHYQSAFYNVKAFLEEKKTTLKPFELEELGEVRGKTLLHLQCHFGMDTLSWAREGAIVTGVDFSPEAVRLAKKLAKEAGLKAEFIEADIYELPNKLKKKFDIVYTSFGVIVWLPDLFRWAKVISHFLKTGGKFYFAEFHPFAQIFDEEHPSELKLKYDYFHSEEPHVFQNEGGYSYAATDEAIKQPVSYEWQHSLSDIFNALIQEGLRIDSFKEYPYTFFKQFAFAQERENGSWHLLTLPVKFPLTFSLLATKL